VYVFLIKQEVKGDWICIKVEPSLLGGPIVYEAPAPVGNIEAFDYVKAPEFPHIYGGIPLKAVLATHRYSLSFLCLILLNWKEER
jgi:uncharacterized protein (DUF952 family)